MLILINIVLILISGNVDNFKNAFEGSNFRGLGTAFYSGLYSYAGWWVNECKTQQFLGIYNCLEFLGIYNCLELLKKNISFLQLAISFSWEEKSPTLTERGRAWFATGRIVGKKTLGSWNIRAKHALPCFDLRASFRSPPYAKIINHSQKWSNDKLVRYIPISLIQN